MSESEFNLLHERWIPVCDQDGRVTEVSLTEAFERAHELRGFAGDVPPQDVVLLRLMLAVLYCVYLRRDEDGNERELVDEEDAESCWRSLWDRGSFDMEVIGGYLQMWEDRFYLFDDDHPFYQANIERGTEYPAAKLYGSVSESNNKPRLFSMMTGEAKERMSFPEAARWLLYLNSFDDTSSKPSVKGAGMPTPGAGWLGKLGIVYVIGSNMFETLMLNFVLCDEDGPMKDGTAVWEKDEPDASERVEVPFPQSPVELLTLQCRRIKLEREGDTVSGYILLGGDVVRKENALLEQMTMWRMSKECEWIPRRHDPARALWRDFSSLLIRIDDGENSRRKPGVIRWMSRLVEDGTLDYSTVNVGSSGVKYADKDFFVEDLINDTITVSSGLLTELGESWNLKIDDSIRRSEYAVRILGDFARDVEDINGGSDAQLAAASERARARAYLDLDQPFRGWLSSINPEVDDMDTRLNEWDRILFSRVSDLGKAILEESGTRAMIGIPQGKESGEKQGSKVKAGDVLGRNAFTSFRIFRGRLNKLLKGSD